MSDFSKMLRSTVGFLLLFAGSFGGIFAASVYLKGHAQPQPPAPVQAVEPGATQAPFVSGAMLPPSESRSPRGHRLAYTVARKKAAERYAKDNSVSLDYARLLMERVDDATITAAAKVAGIEVESIPTGESGPLGRVLEWLATHQEIIARLIDLILLLAPLFV